MDEIFILGLYVFLIHSISEQGDIYLHVITKVHRLYLERNLHSHLDSKSFENKNIFLSPQPPKGFGTTIC